MTSENLVKRLTSSRRSEADCWQGICADLTVDGKQAPNSSTFQFSDSDAEKARERLDADGYALVGDVLDVSLVKKVKQGIEELHHQKLPPTFVLLFDQAWDLAKTSQRIMNISSHERNLFNFDLLAWYIEPGGAGFSPHRDRQPEEASTTFHPDGQSKFITHWISLSESTPQNSCLHVIPRKCDPGYVDGDTDEKDPLYRALPDKESFQHIRALPRQPGQSVLFTHRIIHWGSRSDRDSSTPPRVAISFVCSDPSFEPPLVKAEHFSESGYPPFHIRLLLVCAQLLIYYQRFSLTKEVIMACYDYCKTHQEELDDNYRKKVMVEFMKAMKEPTTDPDNNNDTSKQETDLQVPHGAEEHDDDDDEAAEEAMLEEMLNAEAEGYGEFEDDYENIEGEADGDDVEEGVAIDSDEVVGAVAKKRRTR